VTARSTYKSYNIKFGGNKSFYVTFLVTFNFTIRSLPSKYCEELNNSPQILEAATTDGRPLTSYAANSRSNGAARSGWRRREFGDQGWKMREFGDKGAENERVETWRAERECRVQKGITELHRTLDFAVNFGLEEEVPHLGSGAAHRRPTCTNGTAALCRTSVGNGA